MGVGPAYRLCWFRSWRSIGKNWRRSWTVERDCMANPDHLAKLKEGVEIWNSWRLSNRGVVPDLSKADLRRADLSGTDLRRANLAGADVSGANLSGAYLGRANLSGADLKGARLSGAALRYTKFSKADLSQADLSEADLTGANLSQAKLRKAKLMGANLSKCNLTKSDASGADLCNAYLAGTKLSGADLTESDLTAATVWEADLKGADLTGANLMSAELSFSNFEGACLNAANLSGASLVSAKLVRSKLYGANLGETDLRDADLSGADLSRTLMVRTRLSNTNLTGCSVYGLSVWDAQLDGTLQSNLVITPKGAPAITVDNLEVAQFIYLLLNNQRIRHVIDSITSKVVLILGRFTPERKVVLDAIRDELRKRDYLPVLFDFEKPSSRDITETVSTLAHMAKFVIADITDAKSIPQELMAIVPTLPSVPVQPLLLASQREYGMFEHFKRFPWVLRPYLYKNQDRLLAALNEKVIGPAETKAREQTGR